MLDRHCYLSARIRPHSCTCSGPPCSRTSGHSSPTARIRSDLTEKQFVSILMSVYCCHSALLTLDSQCNCPEINCHSSVSHLGDKKALYRDIIYRSVGKALQSGRQCYNYLCRTESRYQPSAPLDRYRSRPQGRIYTGACSQGRDTGILLKY